MAHSENLVTSITPNQRADFLRRLRAARALILRDAESFGEASTVLEHIGQAIGGRIGKGLKDYEVPILKLAREVHGIEEDSVRRLFNVVREARNRSIHDGAYARHLSSRLVDLLLILEEATMTNMDRVEDLMVRNPVFAESWHLVSYVRQMMLTNSFTWIPIYQRKDGEGRWMLLRDSTLMRWIRLQPIRLKQKERLAIRIEDAITKHALAVNPANCCNPRTSIAELLAQMNDDPTLVTQMIDGEERLLGIITPFDLL
jgi:CBS-domain-containing membrane protein